ncbi:unnamed protein product [Paramecium sonneborni]|uniref:RRP15-like protein n=1 Tax=Paramecium sonneborni TaxID=65129 RepID=A0A8S1P7D8_9CILI|nr:unnamed protein product [Paramecium sonneborni]
MLNRQIKSKKVKNLIKKFDAEDEDEHQEEHESQQEEVQQQTKQSLKQLLSGVIKRDVKSEKAIMADKQKILNELTSEKQKQKEMGIKKSIKKAVVEKGHIDPRVSTNRDQERELKVIAAKGLVKVFNVLAEMRQKQNE